MSFILAPNPQIPSRLYHYTKASNAMSILTGGIGIDKEICFWLKNCKEKNDDKETVLGQKLVESVRSFLIKEGMMSMLEQICIDEKSVFTNSFSEGEVNQYMLNEYGNIRLEFDFRSYKHNGKIEKCQYLTDEDVAELAQLYISDFKSVKGNRSENALLLRIEREYDIVSKIATLKSEKQWEGEEEWRHIFHKQQQDSRIFTTVDGKERMKVYYPQSTLTGITIFYHKEKTDEQIEWYNKFKKLVKTNHWDKKSVQLRHFKPRTNQK